MIAGLALGRLLPWLIGAAVFGGGYLWHEWQAGKLEQEITEATAEITRLRDNVGKWKSHAEYLQAQMVREREQLRQAELSVRNLLLELGEVKQDTRSLIVAVEEAPPSDDGAVAPVLARALDGLAQ